MASKKDLVEAYAYNRRRLVTAFVSGAPGGREVEPSRPGRAIIAGLVLAAMVVGGGAMAGVIKPTVKNGWDNNSLVVARKTGARYVSQNGNLFPVRNTASARLLIAPGEFKVVFAPEDRIAESTQGPLVGIDQAPDSIPLASDLIQTGWTSCVEDSTVGNAANPDAGISIQLSRAVAAEPATGEGLVVRAGNQLSLITGRLQYPIAPAAQGTVLLGLGLQPEQVVDVPAEWLNLFTAGLTIQPLTVGQPGAAPTVAGLPADVKQGQILVNDKAANLVVADGVVPLTDLQALMYRVGYGKQMSAKDRGPLVLPAGTTPAGLADKTVNWPQALPAGYALNPNGKTNACVILDANDRTFARTILARPKAGAFLNPAKPTAIKVDPARGALVTPGTDETTYLIDATGHYYPLGKSGEAAQLGFADVKQSFVPQTWIALFSQGPTLDRAKLTPATAPAPSPATSAAPAVAAAAPVAARRQ